jgi:hypothetical protein
VPAAALLASAEVNGVDVGQLVDAARENVKARIADLEAQLLPTVPERSRVDANGNGSDGERADLTKKRTKSEPAKPA